MLIILIVIFIAFFKSVSQDYRTQNDLQKKVLGVGSSEKNLARSLMASHFPYEPLAAAQTSRPQSFSPAGTILFRNVTIHKDL